MTNFSSRRQSRPGIFVGLIVLATAVTSVISLALQDEEPVARAVSLATDGDYESALEIFSFELESAPEDPKLNYYVGICHHFLERDQEAITYLRTSISKEPSFPEPYYWLARILLANGERREGIEILNQGLQRFPKNEKLQTLSASSSRD